VEINYQVCYQEEVLRTHIPELPLNARNMIKRAIEERLMVDPVHFGKPLRYSMEGHRRLRVSHYRIVYRIEIISNTVIIVAIKNRKEVYDW
jgi:mRNA-degrading endonuclease RelE of RelBE toxin-antitoxin system